MPKRKLFALPAPKRPKPRWLVLSVAGHAAAIGTMIAGYRGFVSTTHPHTEIVAIAIPGAPRTGSPPPPAAGRVRPALSQQAPQATLDPAPITPTAEPAAPVGVPSGVTGGVVGARGLGLTPSSGDPRLWVGPMFIPEGGGRAIDMDSLVRRRMLVMADIMDSIARHGGDSLAPYRPQYSTPSWTFDSNGRTYGIDNQWIHLGWFKIPTAALALIPIPVQGNYEQNAHNQQMMNMRADILRAAARSEAEDDFRRAVSQIRERKDKERREQRQREEEQRRRDRPDDRPIP